MEKRVRESARTSPTRSRRGAQASGVGSSVRALAALGIGQADPGVESFGSCSPDQRKEPEVAGKKRPKSLAQTEKKAPAKAKRPKKISRGK
jgi:hypothetical protein